MEEQQLEIDTWKVINSYFEDNKYFLTSHQIDSFNDFISSKLPQTIREKNPLRIYKKKIKTGEENEYKYEINIYFGGKEGNKIYIGRPTIYDSKNERNLKQMFPNEARLRNLNYSSPINLDIYIEFIIRTGQGSKTIIKELNNINIGKIPIMLHSKYCILNNQSKKMLIEMGESPYEQGGYFIINGKEKTILSQERVAENKLHLMKKNIDDSIYSDVVEIKSVADNSFKPAKSNAVKLFHKNSTILVTIPNIRKPIPLFILFRALGIESDKEIIKYIFPDIYNQKNQMLIEKLRPTIANTGPIYSQIDARNYLKSLTRFRTLEHLQLILDIDFLPHINNQIGKIYYLGFMVNNLLKLSENLIDPTDRDSFAFKRIDLSGFLLASLFREYYEIFLSKCNLEIDKLYNYNNSIYDEGEKITNLISIENKFKIFNPNIIENGLIRSMKGNWGVKDDPSKQGIVQDLNRLSYLGTISHLRRVNLPNIRNTKLVGPRRLHNSTWGIMCPVETPDGGNIGCIKHFSIMAKVSFGSNANPILQALRDNNIIPISEIIPEDMIGNTTVFVNGNIIGIHKNAPTLIKNLRILKRNACIYPYSSIIWNINNMIIEVNTDAGRCIRPVFSINNNQNPLNKEIIHRLNTKTINWENMVYGNLKKKRKLDQYSKDYICPNKEILDLPKNLENIYDYLQENQGILEYIDVEESETSLISTRLSQLKEDNENKYTHSEIHPSMILGVMGLIIPFAEHNQAPRNLFSAGQSKQSIGLYTSNYKNRLDQAAYVLSYPQRPLITTRMMNYITEEKLPYGENAIVAIACYSGYNQEDAVIMNKSSLQRGLFRSTYLRTYTEREEDAKINGTDTEFIDPIIVNAKNIKLGKDYTKLNKYGFIKKDQRITDKDIIIGKVNKVQGEDGTYYIDSSIKPKKNTKGFIERVFVDINENDKKLCKVCIREERIPEVGDKFSSRAGQKGTIGMVVNQEDMPFTKDGIVPDIIVNPHAIPSRMTIGQLIEAVFGKLAACKAFIADASPFTNAEHPIEIIGDYLQENCGFERNGNEILYNGRNGKQLECSIFIGPTYYMRLKHLVKDKFNSRAKGPNMYLTRQPAIGRANDGGLRLGEMERDAILAHGISAFLNESFMKRSDEYSIYISHKTGSIVPVNKSKNIYPSEDYSLIRVPYTFKLLMQELEAMSVTPRLITKFDKYTVSNLNDDTTKHLPTEESIKKIQPKKNKKQDKSIEKVIKTVTNDDISEKLSDKIEEITKIKESDDVIDDDESSLELLSQSDSEDNDDIIDDEDEDGIEEKEEDDLDSEKVSNLLDSGIIDGVQTIDLDDL